MIYIASDHAGFELKNKIVEFLKQKNIQFEDMGPFEFEKTDDYPDFALKVGEKISKNKEARGILICGTGQGMCTAANKFPGIYAVVAWDKDTAEHAAKHNGANVLCLGQSKVDPELAKQMVKTWLNATEGDSERHVRRKNKIREIEKRFME